MAGFDPDKYLSATPSTGFDPDAYLSGTPPAPANKPKREATMKEAMLSLIAPGGISRMASQAQKSYDNAAYDLGGNVTDQASKILPPGGAAAAGFVANLGMQAIPTLLGASAGSAVGKPMMEGAGRAAMKSAIKPLVAHKDKAPAAIETMLKGGYSPTNAGVAAMRDKVGALTAQADQVIAPSRKVIDLNSALQNVSGVADKARAATMGVRDADTALDVGKQLMAHPSVDAIGTMSVPAAQAMKQSNYKALGDAAYGMGLKPAAERDALKAITRALKDNIEKAEPGVAPINKQISELVNALKVSSRRAAMEGNKDIVPLGASVATALNNPVAAMGLYANSSAAIKAMLARMLYSGAKGVPAAVGGTVGGAVGAASGREKNE